jgi:phospholipid/cholesterol/gamma-HCH transport system ATP-binding protein
MIGAAGFDCANAGGAKRNVTMKRYAMTFMVSEIYNRRMGVFIEFIDVYKSFGERQILDGVSFQVEQGESFAILGPSGIGKTVTLTHIVGLLKPDSGRIMSMAKTLQIWVKGNSRLSAKVQLVFQSGALFDSMTVAENISVPVNDAAASDEIDRRVQKN